MREYAKKPENKSRTLDSNPRASKQAPISEILQAYRNRTFGKPVQRQSADEEELLQAKAVQQDQVNAVSQRYSPDEDDELLQGKFDTSQRETIDEEEILQGKFESTPTIEQESIQREVKPNNTGLPDNLKSGIENLSGYGMDDVKVHYNSDKPTQLNALAYAQGTDIHIALGQEKHLPHEAWHVVQQKQGRVQPTMQMQGVNVNDNEGLEKEADFIGERLRRGKINPIFVEKKATKTIATGVLQLAREYIIKKNFSDFIKTINETVAKAIYGKGDMPDKQTDELVNHFITEIENTINQASSDDLTLLYETGKAPEVDVMRTEIIDLFKSTCEKQKYSEAIEKGRRKQLQARQEKTKPIDVLSEYSGLKKTVIVHISTEIKESEIDWDVIWNKIMQYGFYPVHVALESLAPYTDDLKDGSHFRRSKTSDGNYFYDIESDGDDKLTLTIHDFWPKKHPSRKTPWVKPQRITYDDYEFTVAGDQTKSPPKKKPKMRKVSTYKSLDITEAQKLTLTDLGRIYKEVTPDGFCLTEAIGLSMDSNGEAIRNDVITRLFSEEANVEINLRIIETFDTIDNFILDLTSRTAWTGEFGDSIISGIALILNINIFVINEDGTITNVETPGADQDVYVTRIKYGGGHFGATSVQ